MNYSSLKNLIILVDKPTQHGNWSKLAHYLNAFFTLIFLLCNIAIFALYMLPLLEEWIRTSYNSEYYKNIQHYGNIMYTFDYMDYIND